MASTKKKENLCPRVHVTWLLTNQTGVRSCLFARFERAVVAHVVMHVPSVSLGADRRAARTRPVAWPMARPVAPPERPGSRLVQGFRARCGRRCCCRAGRALRGQGGMRWTRARRGHSGHAGCAVRRCGVYSSERAGRRGAGGAATSSCMPLIVQLQSERGVCAGTSTRMKSWPLCHHARGTHAMNTQICALSSLFVTAERASTGVSVHQCNQA